MNSDILKCLGIMKKVEVSLTNQPHQHSFNQIVHRHPISRRLLLFFPLSSSVANSFKAYDELQLSPSSARECVKRYESSCRTVKRQKVSKLKKKKKKRLNAEFLLQQRKRVRVNYFGPKKKFGPILRVVGLNLSRYSSFFRYSFSPRERRRRFKQLEYGLTSSARALVRRVKPCRIRVSRMDPHQFRAYRDCCRVRLTRLELPQLRELRPTLSLSRLTPDQLASGMAAPSSVFRHSFLKVRLSRMKSPEAVDATPPQELEPNPGLREVEDFAGADVPSPPNGLAYNDILRSSYLRLSRLPPLPTPSFLDPEEIPPFGELDISSLFESFPDFDSAENASITSSATSAIPSSETTQHLPSESSRTFLRNKTYRKWATAQSLKRLYRPSKVPKASVLTSYAVDAKPAPKNVKLVRLRSWISGVPKDKLRLRTRSQTADVRTYRR